MQTTTQGRKAEQGWPGAGGRREGETLGSAEYVPCSVVVMVSQFDSSAKTYQIVGFPYAQFTACQLDVNETFEELKSNTCFVS